MESSPSLRTLVGKPWFWVLLIGLIATVPAVRAILAARALPSPLPVLATVPDFSLTDEQGLAFRSAEKLRGKVWVASFLFTRCPTVCPKLTAKMNELQSRGRQLGEWFHLVSVTVDPEFDTPEVLKAYAQKHQVATRTWSFLTGSREDLQHLVVDGLKIYMAKDGPAEDFASYAHGAHFVLVDSKMQLRGFYDSNEAGAVDSILRDVSLLVNRGD